MSRLGSQEQAEGMALVWRKALYPFRLAGGGKGAYGCGCVYRGNNGSQEVQAVGCPPGPHPGLTLHFQLAPLTLAVADFWSCLYKLRRRFQGVAPTWEEASLRSPVERWWSLIAHSNKRQPRPRRTGPSGG